MNQFLFRTFLTALILLSIPITTKAYDFEYNGLYYNITSEENKTVEVTYIKKVNNYTYEVANVKGDIKIPKKVQNEESVEYTVTAIGARAFNCCDGLTSVELPNSITIIGDDAFGGCFDLTTVNIPPSVTTIESSAFTCTGLISISIPSSVIEMGNSAFGSCANLSSATIGAKAIGNYAFCECYSLSSVTLLNTVTSIGNSSFTVSGLTDISIPNSVISIGKNAFSGCDNLEKVILPNSITSIGDYICQGCPNVTIYAFPCPYKLIENGTNGSTKKVLIGAPFFSYNYTNHQESLEFKFYKSMECESAPEGYENLSIAECGIDFDGTLIPYNNKGKVTIKNLKSNTGYKMRGYTKYSDGNIYFHRNDYFKYTTNSLKPSVTTQVNPTSCTISCSYTLDDAKLKKEYITIGGTTIDGNKATFTGLKPEMKYSGTYTVTTQGGSSETKNFTLTTPALKIDILDPRPVSEKCAIVAATTNMSDHETSVGFQWRKYEAPASLKSSEGYAAIYGGKLEGYIKNLQSTSYYNVRAFYKASDNTYYYSDWVTFDPSDFSYFEPTVHTYPTAEVASTSATVKGYALAGSDDIIQQGIEYWASGSHNAPKKVAAALPAADGINTVFSTGQVMTVTLTDLKPETTYCYRAFVKTQAGTTYGEEQSFTTPEGQSGVESVIVDNEREVIGYYDLTGRRYDVPQRGHNIIVYSDGTTEKVIIRQ